jgi:hypothetical protein
VYDKIRIDDPTASDDGAINVVVQLVRNRQLVMAIRGDSCANARHKGKRHLIVRLDGFKRGKQPINIRLDVIQMLPRVLSERLGECVDQLVFAHAADEANDNPLWRIAPDNGIGIGGFRLQVKSGGIHPQNGLGSKADTIQHQRLSADLGGTR